MRPMAALPTTCAVSPCVYTTRSLILAFLAFTVFGSVAHAGVTAEVKVMSFNVFGGNGISAVFGPGSWYNASDPDNGRRFLVRDVINDFAPDILGLQETSSTQTGELAEFLPQYNWYGLGRDDGVEAGEYAAIFYRADRFDLLEEGTFWMSPTPDVPGTVFSGAGSIRAASWVKLYDRQTFQDYFVLNTHLDNVSSTANRLSAELIRAKFHELADGLPIIMTGDFNELETSSTLRTLLGEIPTPDFPMYDAYREVFPVRTSQERTYHFDVFTGSTSGSRIDYVLHSGDFTAIDASIVRTSVDGIYPSDHYPVTATLSIAVPEVSSLAMLGLVTVAFVTLRRRWSS